MLRIGLFVVFLTCSCITASNIVLNDNAYSGIVIAINPAVPEDLYLISAIQDAWTEASSDLYTATKRRAFYHEITILIPKTWSKQNYYDRAGSETYEMADVLVAQANPVYQDTPYTLQYGKCGEPASYIHLTPDYLRNASFVQDFGPRGKAIVHEWAHLRWGVFDETYTTGYSPYYFASDGSVQATRCPVTLSGSNKVIDYSTGTSRDCQKNLENGLMEDGCQFLPSSEQTRELSTSLMSHQYLSEVTMFCHDDQTDPYNLHNKEAPNEQNRLCDLKSTWEVIMESKDFVNGTNPTKDGLNTKPSFRLVQVESSKRYVLVLDTSGSMKGTRLQQMRQAVSMFISQSVPIGDQIAIVEFSDSAHTLASLRLIQSENDREYLLSRIPTSTGGKTCIGCGIQQAVSLLEQNGESAFGGNIVVFTDGAENKYPYVTDVADEVVQKMAIVDAIYYTTSANADLEQLVIDTNGVWYFGNENDVTAILGAFQTIAEHDDGDVFTEIFEVHSTSFNIDKYSTYTGSVAIDSTVGNKTVFSFTWSQYDIAINVELEHPSGCTFSTNPLVTSNSCDGHPLAVTVKDFDIVEFPLPGTAEVGLWRYYVSTSSAYSQQVTATVTSAASSTQVEPIVVSSGLDQTDVGTGQAIVVYAQVSQGFSPILGAQVFATIGKPDGSDETVELYDAGAAPDVRLNDGVYSRYFTGYNQPGRYSVEVKVSNTVSNTSTPHSGSSAALNVGTINSQGTVVLNPNAAKYQTRAPTSGIGNFSRVVTNAGFSYSGIPVIGDPFPPSRILDLFVEQNDVYSFSQGLSLTFTAPGSDFDSGNASRYDLRYTINNVSQLLYNFASCDTISIDHIKEGSLTSPQQAGTKETLVVLPDLQGHSDKVTIAFAIRAYDAVNNVGDPSNAAPITFFITPPGDSATVHLPGKVVTFAVAILLALLL